MTDHQGRQSEARRSLPERGCSTALPCHQKRRDTQQAKRADGFLWAPCRYSDQGALLFVMVLSDFRYSALHVLEPERVVSWSCGGAKRNGGRNEASSSRGGGRRLAVRCWVAFEVGRCGDEGSAGQRQLACVLGRAAQTERSGVRRLWYRVPGVGYGQRW